LRAIVTVRMRLLRKACRNLRSAKGRRP
jgi:hypothetical protein